MSKQTWLGLVLAVCLLQGCSAKSSVRKTPVFFAPGSQPVVVQANSNTATGEKKTMLDNQNEPVDITSDRMQYKKQGQVTVFQGNVRVVQPRAVMHTQYLEVRSQQGVALARQGIVLEDYQRGLTITAQEMDYSKNLSDVKIREQVKLKAQDAKGQTLAIQSKSLEWHADKEEAQADGNVVVHYQDTTATAGHIQFQSAADKLVLSSQPQQPIPELQRGSDRISGQVITVYSKAKIYEVDGTAKAVILLPAANSATAMEKKP